MEPISSNSPITFTFEPAEKVARWRPFFNWVLAIPHLVIASLLGYVAQLLAFVSWIVILFSGKLPAPIAGFQVMYLRYTARNWMYVLGLHEEYPPFGFATTDDDPGDARRVRLDARPRLEDRNRVSTFFRIVLVIPHLLVLAVLGIGAWFAWLIGVLSVLFTGRWPEGVRDFLVKVVRWGLRVNGYLYLLTDEYPPFSLE